MSVTAEYEQAGENQAIIPAPDDNGGVSVRAELRRVMNCPKETKKVWIKIGEPNVIINEPHCIGCIYQHDDEQGRPFEAPLETECIQVEVSGNKVVLVYCQKAPRDSTDRDMQTQIKQF